MHANLLFASLLGGVLVAGATSSPAGAGHATSAAELAAPAGPVGIHYKGVHVDYGARSGSRGTIDTELVLVNTSATQPLRLREIAVLGPLGVSKVLSIYRGVAGTVVPPLGQVVVPVDQRMGISRRGPTRTATDATNVVVGWEGSARSLRLTSIIQNWEASSSNSGFRGTTIAEGYDITF